MFRSVEGFDPASATSHFATSNRPFSQARSSAVSPSCTGTIHTSRASHPAGMFAMLEAAHLVSLHRRTAVRSCNQVLGDIKLSRFTRPEQRSVTVLHVQRRHVTSRHVMTRYDTNQTRRCATHFVSLQACIRSSVAHKPLHHIQVSLARCEHQWRHQPLHSARQQVVLLRQRNDKAGPNSIVLQLRHRVMLG